MPPSSRRQKGADEGSSKHREILDEATRLFAEKGFQNTSVRDIADRVGLLSGSLYYHFKSKEELFEEVHRLAMDRSEAELRRAADAQSSPWERLRAVCRRLVEMQVDPTWMTSALMADIKVVTPSLRAALIQRRDAYELFFQELVEDLGLPPTVDRKLARLTLLTMLNNVANWYRPGRLTPSDIADFVIDLFRGLAAERA